MTARHVSTWQELTSASGLPVVAHGRYEARQVPIRGTLDLPRPVDRAVVVLEDGVAVWLEPLDSPMSVRSADELERFHGRSVRVEGIRARGDALLWREPESRRVSATFTNWRSNREQPGARRARMSTPFSPRLVKGGIVLVDAGQRSRCSASSRCSTTRTR